MVRRETKMMKIKEIEIEGHKIGPGFPVYIVAELSGNHRQRFDEAVRLIYAAKEAGADAVKLQTYTADTITISVDRPEFRTSDRSLWAGRSIYELYKEASTPWDWQPKLKKVADDLGITLFSSPFDKTAVDFLDSMNAPAFKVASFEIVDIPLIEYIASKGKPVIISTGLANLSEIEEAVSTARKAGATQISLLKCTSSYPAEPEDMNLRTIPHMAEAFGVPVGLSDHTLGIAVPVAAVAMGACIIEKHFVLSRSVPSVDSAFSLEPQEFKSMVEAVRTAEKSLGEITYNIKESEEENRVGRRSLFAVKDIQQGELFTEENVRSIRPNYGLHPRYLKQILGRKAVRNIQYGTPLGWDLISQE
jgi:pseudaminic acid synthase